MTKEEKYKAINNVLYNNKLYNSFVIYGKEYFSCNTAKQCIRNLKEILKFDTQTLDRLLNEMYHDNPLEYIFYGNYMLYSDRIRCDVFEIWIWRKLNEIIE